MNNNQGLSPEKVEKLMKWIDKEVFDTHLGERHDALIQFKEQLQSLLSSTQPERQVGEGEITESDDKKFLKYANWSREEFVKKYWELRPSVEERVIAEDLLICFDQLLLRWSEALASHRNPSITTEEAKDTVVQSYKRSERTFEDLLSTCIEGGVTAEYAKIVLLKCIDEAILLYAKHSTPVTQEGETLQWISVKDRLPEIGDRVLVLEIGYRIQICTYQNVGPYGYEKVDAPIFADEQDEQPSAVNPHYWMPLPKEPNEPSTTAAGQEEKK